MSCDICGGSSCANYFHSTDEQERYAKVIELFERAREERDRVKNSETDEEAI
mgnify:FL=1